MRRRFVFEETNRNVCFMMLQLNPPIPLKTPKGNAWATALIDYGPQWDLLWVTFIEQTGECWTFRNPEVRQGKNYTFDHPDPTPITPRPPQQGLNGDFSVPYVNDKHNGRNGHAV